jgi:hypothetical protein
VVRWTAEQYVEKRIPSYCDRILVKSLPEFDRRVVASLYESCPKVLSSDHKPVRVRGNDSLFPCERFLRFLDNLSRVGFVHLCVRACVTRRGR